MPRRDLKRRPITLTLPPALVERLDGMAEGWNTTRTALIERAIVNYVGREGGMQRPNTITIPADPYPITFTPTEQQNEAKSA